MTGNPEVMLPLSAGPLDNFRIADHPGVIARWLESRCGVLPRLYGQQLRRRAARDEWYACVDLPTLAT